MISAKRYQIFVSSTYEDLKVERQQVAQAILELEHFPAGMEIFPASNEAQWELIKKFIAESDYFVVVVGGRYGSIDIAGVSYTEKEFDYAEELGIPILGFLRRNIETIPANKVDKDRKSAAKLEGLRKKIQTKHCRHWDTPEELGLVVSKSLLYMTRTFQRVGWVRSDMAKSVEEYEKVNELRNRIESLEKDNAALTIERNDLERLVRNSVLPEKELAPELLAQGDDIYEFICFYTGVDKKRKTRHVRLTWNEIFQAIGPSMFGFLVRKNQYTSKFDFEKNLESLIRSKISEDAEGRKIEIMDSAIDTMMLQFKQLGYLVLETNEKDFTGWTLTPKGEASLTRLKTISRKKLK